MSHRGVALEKMGVSEHQGSGGFSAVAKRSTVLQAFVYGIYSGLGERFRVQDSYCKCAG